MRRVSYSSKALSDLAGIHAFVRDDNPRAATEVIGRIVARIAALDEFAERGAPRPRLARGLRCVLERPYVIYYLVSHDEVVVARVVHGARRITRRLLREK